MHHGATPLAMLVFLGGLSAASAMVIVASIALATMITNDLIMPMLWRGRWLGLTEGRRRRPAGALVAPRHDPAARPARLRLPPLPVSPASLASIGLLAFAAVAQFAPAILAGLYWRGATREGVFWGLLAGYVVWIYTLLLPNLSPAECSGRPCSIRGRGASAGCGRTAARARHHEPRAARGALAIARTCS